MPSTNPMDEDRETIVADIKDRVQKGEYRVDPQAVADAIIRRLRYLALYRDPRAVGFPPHLRTQN